MDIQAKYRLGGKPLYTQDDIQGLTNTLNEQAGEMIRLKDEMRVLRNQVAALTCQNTMMRQALYQIVGHVDEWRADRLLDKKAERQRVHTLGRIASFALGEE